MSEMRIAAVVLSACAASHPLPSVAVRPLVGAHASGVPGEVMDYDISFRDITVGHVTTVVGKPGIVDGHRAIIVRSRGQSVGIAALAAELDWNLSTTLDIDRGVPLEQTETFVANAAGRREHGEKHRTYDEGEPLDIHSTFGVIRAWPSETKDLAITTRIDGLTTELAIHETVREHIRGQPMPVIRYDGSAMDGKVHFWLWLSDDTARVPIRFVATTKWGLIRAELVAYDAPSE